MIPVEILYVVAPGEGETGGMAETCGRWEGAPSRGLKDDAATA